MSDDRRIPGYCPCGCGQTLFAASGGYITCSFLECPCPDAVSKILDDPEHEHIVKIDSKSFSVQHPLRERIDGELFDCGLHGWMRALSGPPAKPGRYRARKSDEGRAWTFEELPPAPPPPGPTNPPKPPTHRPVA